MKVPAEIRDAIAELNLAYAQCLDDNRLDAWLDFFPEDGIYKIVPRDNLEGGFPLCLLLFEGRAAMRDRVLCVRDVNIFRLHWTRHFLGQPSITSEGEGWRVRTNVMVAHTDSEGHSAVYAVGEYRDLVVRSGEDLLFKERAVILDSFMIESHMAEPI
jgi:3-phenylpropionate/cinnamic acid dioxygenase small subunit